MLLNGAPLLNNPRMGNVIPFQRPGMAGMGEGEYASPLDDITSTIRDLVTVYNQQQILEANIERASRGLPPINTAALAPTYNVGLSPDTKNMLIVGGLVLAAILLLNQGRGRR